MHRCEKIIDGIKISYISHEKDNENPVVVFLHGWASEGMHFKNIFPKDYSYIAIDFPPFGKSGSFVSSLDLLDFSNITKKWIEHCIPCHKKIILVGHSFGGRVILKMLSEKLFSHQIEKIICIGVPFYRVRTWKHECIETVARYSSYVPFFKKNLKKILYTFWKSSDYEDLADNEVLKKTFQNIINEPIDPYFSFLSPFHLFLLWGENDEVAPVLFAQQVQSFIPSASLTIIPNAGHMPFIDNPIVCRNEFFKMLQK